MKSYILKVYPHMLMDRTQNDRFSADAIAGMTIKTIMLILRDTTVKHVQLDDYQIEIHEPEVKFESCNITSKVVDQILQMFPEVSKIDCWIEFPIQPKRKLDNIEKRFQADALDAMDYGEEDWMSY